MTLKIAGMGTASPDFSIEQSEVAEVNQSFCHGDERKRRLIPGLYRRAGVRKRHSVLLETPEGEPFSRQSLYHRARGPDDLGPTTRERMQVYEQHAPRLATRAARRAVDDADIAPRSITHLVTVSCTGFLAPGIDAALIDGLGLRRTVQRTHVGFMGCHGALNGLRVASSFTGADPAARVLLCAVELCTLHFFYGWDAEKIVANSLFADGAGALVGVSQEVDATEGGWTTAANGTLLMPGSADAMTWNIGDHGFHMTLSARVPELIRRNLADWLQTWLAANDLVIDDVATWAVHPGGPRILSAFAEAAGIDGSAMDVSRRVLSEFGNMSAATLLFILERLRHQDAPRPCVAVGFGPGMVVEAALLR